MYKFDIDYATDVQSYTLEVLRCLALMTSQ